MAGHIWLSPCSGGPEFKARTWKGHRKVGCKKKKERELHSNSIGHWTMQISMENNVHLHLDTSLVFHFRCPFNGGNSVELGVGTKKSSWGYALGNTSSWLACCGQYPKANRWPTPECISHNSHYVASDPDRGLSSTAQRPIQSRYSAPKFPNAPSGRQMAKT